MRCVCINPTRTPSSCRPPAPHRPGDPVVAPLDHHLGPAAHPGHPPEQAVRVHQLEAVHRLVGLPHPGPQPAARVVLHIGERDLWDEVTVSGSL